MNVRILSIGYKIAPESAFRTVLHPGSEAIASMGVAGRTSSWRGGGERAESQRYEL